MKSQNRGTKILNDSATVPHIGGHLCNHSRAPRVETRSMFLWNHRFVYLSTAGSVALMKNEMRELHFDCRQVNDLMGIIRYCSVIAGYLL